MQSRQYELLLLTQRSPTTPRPRPRPRPPRPARARPASRRPLRLGVAAGRLTLRTRRASPRLDAQQYLALEFTVDERR